MHADRGGLRKLIFKNMFDLYILQNQLINSEAVAISVNYFLAHFF